MTTNTATPDSPENNPVEYQETYLVAQNSGDQTFLQFIHDRLLSKPDEGNRNYDYMWVLRSFVWFFRVHGPHIHNIVNREPVAWLCNGDGPGWQERNKIIFDKEMAAQRRASPYWRVEALYIGPDETIALPAEED